jgi:hypothetical protein
VKAQQTRINKKILKKYQLFGSEQVLKILNVASISSTPLPSFFLDNQEAEADMIIELVQVEVTTSRCPEYIIRLALT